MNIKIGVYICHCGSNIAGIVDVHEVKDHISNALNVTVARDLKFMCSDPGQELIRKDITDCISTAWLWHRVHLLCMRRHSRMHVRVPD